MNLRLTYLFFLCVFSFACQETQIPTKLFKNKETQHKEFLDIQALLPKFKYKNVKHLATRYGGLEESQNIQEMGMKKVDSTILKALGLFPNMELYYYAYGRLHKDTYLMAFLGQGMYGLEAFVYVYNTKGKLVYKEDKGILEGGDMGIIWIRDIFIYDDSTYRVQQIHYFSKQHSVEKLIDTTSFKMVRIDSKGQVSVLVKRGDFYSP